MSGNSRRFKMLAYSGAVIQSPYWGRVVFDLAGMRLDDRLPALREHARDRVVGTIDGHSKELAALRAQGYFMGTSDALEVADLIQAGFPYQSSIGVFLETVEELSDEASAQVNGGEFRGPGIIVRQSYVREISFVTLGADAGTSVAALAASSGGGLGTRGGPTCFMEAVKLQMREGLPVRQAIKQAAREHPGLYSHYCAEIGKTNEEFLAMKYPTSDFERKVELFMGEGLTRGQAVKKTVREFPELHKAYLAQVNLEAPVPPAPRGETFESKVQELAAGGLGRAQAIKQAARDFPDLHADYIERLNP